MNCQYQLHTFYLANEYLCISTFSHCLFDSLDTVSLYISGAHLKRIEKQLVIKSVKRLISIRIIFMIMS